jgi:preprotein translocase subunit SecD
VLAVDWANLGYAGTFIVGALVGVITTIRLSKVIVEFFRDVRHHVREDDNER